MSDLTTLRADFASLCAALPAASNSTASPLSNAAREESLGAAISSAVALFTTSDEGELTAATEELSTAATAYGNEVANAAIPFAAVAGLVVLSFLPLWIARCCAHRCCAPPGGCCGPDPPSRARKSASAACCWLWGVGLLAAIGVAALGCTSIAAGIQHTACAAQGALESLGAELQATADDVATFGDAVDGVTGLVDDALVHVSALDDAVDENGGAIALACGDLTTVGTALDNIETTATNAGGSVPAAFSDAAATVREQAPPFCALNSDLAPVVSAARSTLGAFSEALGAADSLTEVTASLAEVKESLESAEEEVLTQLLAQWQFIALLPLLAVGLGSIALLSLVGIGCGSACMAMKKDKSGGCCSCPVGCGVTCTGCGWVWLHMSTPFLLFLGAAVTLTIATLLSDVGAVLRDLPTDVDAALGDGTCDGPLSVAAGNFTVDGCAVLAACWASPSTPIVSSILAQASTQTGIELSAEFIEGQLAAAGLGDERRRRLNEGDDADGGDVGSGSGESGSAALFDASLITDFRDAIDQVVAAGDPCTLSAAVFNVDPSSADGQQIEADLATACSNLASFRTQVTTVVDSADALAVVIDGVPAAAQGVVAAIPALTSALDCGWLPAAYDGVLAPMLWADGMGGIVLLAYALAAAGLVALGFIGTAIAMQVHFGRVYERPRCCCIPCGHREPADGGVHPDDFAEAGGGGGFELAPMGKPPAPKVRVLNKGSSVGE